MNGRTSSVAIIGGGVAGLTAAYRLLQRGHQVHIFEAAPSLGGLVRTVQIGGERVECFYHHLFTTDGAAIRLLDELGLLGTITWRPSRVGMLFQGRVYPFTSPRDLLRFAPLPIRDRIRLGLVALRLRRETDGSAFDNVSAIEWLRENAGQRCLDVVWEPLLRGKFGDMADGVPMAWLWNRVRLRFSSRGALSRREILGYQTGSFAVWTDAIARIIAGLGGEIQTSEQVDTVASEDGRLRVQTAAGRAHYFDAALATISNEAFIRIAPPLGDRYTETLRSVAYQDALCLLLSLSRPLTNFYWLNINDRSVPFLAVVEHTNLVEAKRYGGRHIVYVSNYLRRDSPLLTMNEDKVFALYLPHLKTINPEFDESWVIDRRLFHAEDAQPVFTLGAGSRIADIRTPVPDLYLANMGQIYPQDRGQNYSILLGEKASAIVAEDLARAQVPQYQV